MDPQMESLLKNPGSSAEEFEGNIRDLSPAQLGSLFEMFHSRVEPVPKFVTISLYHASLAKATEETREETREETLAAAQSVELRVLRNRLPFCDDKTDSDANIHPEHDPRSREETIFDFDAVQNIPESVWAGVVNIGSDTDTIPVQSETSVVFYLYNLYRGIIKALGVETKLQVIVTRMVAGNECDIVLAAKETYQPLSVTEVKKPHSRSNDESIFCFRSQNHRRSSRLGKKEKSRTIGQHFNQLHNVQWMNGLTRVYGMISTGNSFMLACTEPFAGNELIIPTEIFATEQDNGNGEDGDSLNKLNLFGNGSGRVSAFSPPDEEKELYTSQVVEIQETGDRADPSRCILNMLIIQVAKALESLEKLPQSETELPVSGTHYARQIDLNRDDTRTGYRQSFSKVKLVNGWQDCRSRYIDGSVKVVSLIRSAGSGASGDCCLAISEKQDMSCVVKFFQGRQGLTLLEQAEAEKANWDQAYGTGDFVTRVVKLGVDKGCLVMPYVDIAGVSRDECLQNDASLLKACLERFSRKDGGLFLLHRDVKWRHLGFLGGNLTLVDLGLVEETQDHKKWEDWMNSCVQELTRSKGSRQQKRRRV